MGVSKISKIPLLNISKFEEIKKYMVAHVLRDTPYATARLPDHLTCTYSQIYLSLICLRYFSNVLCSRIESVGNFFNGLFHCRYYHLFVHLYSVL